MDMLSAIEIFWLVWQAIVGFWLTGSMTPQLRTCRPIPASSSLQSKLSFTLMSYNILAQTLIKRELFPHSGNILKWVCTAMVAFIQGRYPEIPIRKLARRCFWRSWPSTNLMLCVFKVIAKDLIWSRISVIRLKVTFVSTAEVDHVEDFYGEALQTLGYDWFILCYTTLLAVTNKNYRYSFEFCKHPTKLHGRFFNSLRMNGAMRYALNQLTVFCCRLLDCI
jgi:hypothetical protein